MPPLAVILGWPLISAIFFNRFSAPVAVVATIVLGFLLLPHGTTWDLPVLAPIDKLTMPAFSALLFCYVLTRPEQMRQALPSIWPKHWLMQILLIIVPFSTLMMVLMNSDTLVYGTRVLPGLRIYDALSVMQNMLILFIPMLLARKFLSSFDHNITLLRFLVFAGLGYSLLALVEVIMSPQLNLWLYGYFPHSFIQHYRSGGWRPIVFMQHGLVLSLIFSLCTIAALCLFKTTNENKGLMLMATGWLLFTLVLSKSLGALLICILMMGIAFLFRPRMQVIIAAIICGLFLAYPIMRASDTFPVERILEQFARISPERAESLQTRIYHEGQMLEKASERPVFGWGVWGRSRVYDDKTGNDLTIADGYWVISIGVGGWVRYLSTMGLLTFPVFLLLLSRHRKKLDQPSAALALMIAANVIDLVPNSGLTPVTMLLAGALWGRLDARPKENQTLPNSIEKEEPNGSSYTRQRERVVRVPSSTKAASTTRRVPSAPSEEPPIATGASANGQQPEPKGGGRRRDTFNARPREPQKHTRNKKR